jgi:NADPH:quinone reductase-like Zn-dependent oxidoreductase
MRSLSVFGGYPAVPYLPAEPVVVIDEAPVRTRIMQCREPGFDPSTEENARRVLIEVKAFSCNFRDKGFMMAMQSVPRNRFFAIGSEFVAVVREVGAEVSTLRPGDRVIGQNHYQMLAPATEGAKEGVATNQSSRELQVFHEDKLVRIPDAMPDEVAASFSLGAQTAYSMVRKAGLQPGDHVLVTAATSSTSNFLLGALKHRGVHVHATTASQAHDERLEALGVERILRITGSRSSFKNNTEVLETALQFGGYAAVLDPFFDLHIERSMGVLRPFGRYVTCGLAAQNAGAARYADVQPMDAQAILLTAMVNNLSIVGNCVGLREDLDAALADWEAGRFAYPVDSVFTGDDAAPFLARTYVDRSRWGKVVFRYDAN